MAEFFVCDSVAGVQDFPNMILLSKTYWVHSLEIMLNIDPKKKLQTVVYGERKRERGEERER